MAQHYHYIIQAYKNETTEGGLTDVATVDMVVRPGEEPEITSLSDSRRWSKADLEQVALERVRKFVAKPNYRVRDVIEHDDAVCEPKH